MFFSVDVVDVTKVAKVLAVCSTAVVPSLGFDNIYKFKGVRNSKYISVTQNTCIFQT